MKRKERKFNPIFDYRPSLDIELFARIYREYMIPLTKYVFTIVRNIQDAEDIVQDVFLHLPEKWKLYNPALPLKPWLIQVAKYAAISFKRKKQAEPFNEEEHPIKTSSDFSIEELSDILTEKEYEYVVLSYLCGLSNQEIFRVMQVSNYYGKIIAKEAKKKIRLYYDSVYSSK